MWTTASRQRVRVWGNWFNGGDLRSGPWTQVSRLGNPLVNELLIGIGAKDVWNTQPPTTDGREFLNYFAQPLLPQLLPSLYPGVFPNLAAYNAGKSNARPDIEAIFLTGIPAGVITGPYLHQLQRHRRQGGHAAAEHGDPPVLPARTVSGSSAWTWPDTPTAAGSSTTWPPLRCGPWPGRRSATSSRRSPPTGPPARSTSGSPPVAPISRRTVPQHYLPSFPYLGTPYSGYSNPVCDPRVGRAVTMEHTTTSSAGTSDLGSVVLDIGGDLGAAIVHTPPNLDGLEIEIRPSRHGLGRHPCRRPAAARSRWRGVCRALPGADARGLRGARPRWCSSREWRPPCRSKVGGSVRPTCIAMRDDGQHHEPAGRTSPASAPGRDRVSKWLTRRAPDRRRSSGSDERSPRDPPGG